MLFSFCEAKHIVYNIIYKRILGKKKSTINAMVARKSLENVHPFIETSCICERKICETFDYDLDIIIPIYNCEKYLDQCLSSVFQQKTSYNYRVLVVNDGSTDRTAEIIEKYSCNKHLVVINQSNKGVSQARNNALDSVRSKYVMFLDGDDYLDQGAIDKLLYIGFQHNADSVEGSYRFISESGMIICKCKHKNGLINAELDYYGFPWGKVIKSEFFEKVEFPRGYWYEDSIFRQILFPQIKVAYSISDNVYFYRENKKGISHLSKRNVKAIDSLWIMLSLYYDRQKMNIAITQNYYDYILTMSRLTYCRTFRLGRKIEENIFIVFADFVNTNFPDYHTNIDEYKDLEYSLRNYDYGVYILYNLFSNFL